MKFELNRKYRQVLAQQIARDIHARLIAQRLWLVRDTSDHPELYPWPPRYDEFYQEAQKVIRSIEDRWDRREFVADVKFHFHKLREKQCTAIRGRDYVKRVREYEASLKRVA